jgi:hypothetical protein
MHDAEQLRDSGTEALQLQLLRPTRTPDSIEISWVDKWVHEEICILYISIVNVEDQRCVPGDRAGARVQRVVVAETADHPDHPEERAGGVANCANRAGYQF